MEISYKEYQEACKIKSKYESDRRELQNLRAKRKDLFDFDNMPDAWVGQLRYMINHLSTQIAFERDLIKRSMYYERSKNSDFLQKNLRSRLDTLLNDRISRRRDLYAELKNNA